MEFPMAVYATRFCVIGNVLPIDMMVVARLFLLALDACSYCRPSEFTGNAITAAIKTFVP
jgi:hypothetical protein